MPVPEVLRRLNDIATRELFTARIAPEWPGAARSVVLFFPATPAPPGQIQAWTAADGRFEVPETHLRRTTPPRKQGDAELVRAATIECYSGEAPASRLYVPEDTPVLARERHRLWRAQ